jgi:hypothetical protein
VYIFIPHLIESLDEKNTTEKKIQNNNDAGIKKEPKMFTKTRIDWLDTTIEVFFLLFNRPISQ